MPALRYVPVAAARGAVDPRIKALDKVVRGPVLTPGQAKYDTARLVFDSLYNGVHPLAVVQPLDAKDVSQIVNWARKTGVHIVAKSGGHSYGGYSTTPGVVVDLSKLASVRVVAKQAIVGPAARLGNIYNTLGAHGLAIPAGTCPSVGIGGHALGGGFGLASRAWGLASDNLVSVQIVTADGQILVADSKHHSDLYWACRGGGGGNFGIVTRLTFRTHPVTQGSYFIASWPWAQVEQVLASFLAWAPHAPDALGSLCRLAAGPGGPSVQVFGQFLGSETKLKAALATLGPPATKLDHRHRVVARPRAPLGRLPRAHAARRARRPGRRRSSAPPTTSRRSRPRRSSTKFRTAIESRGAASGALLIDSYGGALNRISPAATAFVHRNVLSSIQYFAAGDPTSARAWVNSSRAALKPAVTGRPTSTTSTPRSRTGSRPTTGRTCRGCAPSSTSTTRTTSSTSRRASGPSAAPRTAAAC